MKKIIWFVGFLSLVFCVFAQSTSDFEYKQENGSITITDYEGNSKQVVIPERINGLPVTTIGDSAFWENQLTSVTIPNSVTTIGGVPFSMYGHYAFTGNSVKGAKEPFSVMVYRNTATIIGYNRSEKAVVIPERINGLPVTAIGEHVFVGNQLTSVTIPNSVTTIGDCAFWENQLTSVTIPNSVTTIGDWAFRGNSVKGAKEPFSIMVYRNTVAITGYNRSEKTVVIPERINELPVTTIGNGAFSDNQLTSVTIPNSVTTIGISAFSGNQLTSVTIPNSVTTIGDRAFVDNQLTSVTIPNSVTSIGDDALDDNVQIIRK